jgi:hypothetical protein
MEYAYIRPENTMVIMEGAIGSKKGVSRGEDNRGFHQNDGHLGRNCPAISTPVHLGDDLHPFM